MISEFLDDIESNYIVIEYKEDEIRELYDETEFEEFKSTNPEDSYKIIAKNLCFEDAQNLKDGVISLEKILDDE